MGVYPKQRLMLLEYSHLTESEMYLESTIQNT